MQLETKSPIGDLVAHALVQDFSFLSLPTRNISGHVVAYWLGHYATSLKVAGSIPDEVIGCFNWPNLSSRTMALWSTQSLTEMSTRNLPGSKGRPAGA
jgi:hypothetical protein